MTTDTGRGKAWLRTALNEQSLEKYFLLFLGDEIRLREFYEDWAFFRDEARASLLPSIATSLCQLRFALKLDDNSINSDQPNNLTSSLSGLLSTSLRGSSSSSNNHNQDPELAAETKTEVVIDTSRLRSKKKKKMKGQANVVILDKEETRHVLERPDPVLPISPLSPVTANNSQDLPLLYDSVDLSKKESQTNNFDFDCPEYQDNLTELESEESPAVVVTCDSLTPVTNKSIGALYPVSTARESLLSEDTVEETCSDPVPSLEDLDYASNPFASKSPKDSASKVGEGREVSESSLNKDDLKQALLSVMKRKDELEEQVNSMKKLLDQEINHVAKVKQELSDIKQIDKERQEKLEAKNAIQARENELLKHQLKKYVGAVQKLRDGPHAYETLAKLDQTKSTEQNRYIDYHYEASEYEKKLIQVAEMHGELLEFNENLQKSLQNKDVVINRLKEELISLRGPLPDEEDRLTEDSASICSSYTEVSSIGSAKALVNIWIPTVFLTGVGSGRHHVYQVTV